MCCALFVRFSPETHSVLKYRKIFKRDWGELIGYLHGLFRWPLFSLVWCKRVLCLQQVSKWQVFTQHWTVVLQQLPGWEISIINRKKLLQHVRQGKISRRVGKVCLHQLCQG